MSIKFKTVTCIWVCVSINMNGGNQGATINVDANLTAKCTAITAGIQALSATLARVLQPGRAPETEPDPSVGPGKISRVGSGVG